MIAVIGLGYVGLPLAIAVADHFPTAGLDIVSDRVAELRRGHDRTGEIAADRLRASPIVLAARPDELPPADICISTVPTPVDDANRPDLSPLLGGGRNHHATARSEAPADRGLREHGLARHYRGDLRPSDRARLWARARLRTYGGPDRQGDFRRDNREVDGAALAALDALIADLGGIWRGRDLPPASDRWVP
jgi:hypothetical protein